MNTDQPPRPPQQKRSRAAMERMLDAAQELIAERGVASLTIADVAARTGVAVGTIYSRFASKDALIAAVHDRWLEQVVARVQTEWAAAAAESADFEDFVACYVAAMITMFRDHGALIREFVVRTIAQFAPGNAARHKLQEAFTHVCEAVLAHPDRPEHADRRRVTLAFRAVQSTLEWRVTTPRTEAPDNDWDTLAQDLPRLAIRYLTEETRT
ncbi:TetR/AcrR family transcriptional regulator [Streptomyces lydicus]|uniref:TetR/AcrR family transcriptional regulator n=1 Tax=Streptomyces lydicus TaxID=47763 RepID=UPI0013E2F41D|nr:TetR/AcrR family transcriptional regulator [Streptomyces lydicus]